METLALAV